MLKENRSQKRNLGSRSREDALKRTNITDQNAAVKWCHKAGVTLHFTKYHVAAHYHLNPHRVVIGKDILDAIHALHNHDPRKFKR